jgi:hypothetical protein
MKVWKTNKQGKKRPENVRREKKKNMIQILTKYERKWKFEKRMMDFWTLIWIENVYIDNSKILMFKESRACWDETWKERFSVPNPQVVTFNWPSFSHSYIVQYYIFMDAGWETTCTLLTSYFGCNRH